MFLRQLHNMKCEPHSALTTVLFASTLVYMFSLVVRLMQEILNIALYHHRYNGPIYIVSVLRLHILASIGVVANHRPD